MYCIFIAELPLWLNHVYTHCHFMTNCLIITGYYSFPLSLNCKAHALVDWLIEYGILMCGYECIYTCWKLLCHHSHQIIMIWSFWLPLSTPSHPHIFHWLHSETIWSNLSVLCPLYSVHFKMNMNMNIQWHYLFTLSHPGFAALFIHVSQILKTAARLGLSRV